MRTVHCADARVWLPKEGFAPGRSFVTSLPDISELPGLSRDAYEAWFGEAAGMVLAACPKEGVAIFYQTDVKHQGTWLDKSHLCAKAAEAAGCATLWHRIVLRGPAGSATFGRAGYSHMLCFSRGVRAKISDDPDVMESAGTSSWTRGMGGEACLAACRFIQGSTTSHTVVDPFCGRGMVLAVANSLGLRAIGVEICSKRARRARALALKDPRTPA